MLSEQELIHYSRHIVLPQIDEIGQQKLKNSKVLIVGMGGLGSPVAMYLAAAGVGKLIIADDDQVEASNLQRQVIHNLESLGETKVNSAKKTLQQLNPWVEVINKKTRLQGDELVNLSKEADLIIDCTDNFNSRFAINKAAVLTRRPLVSGAAIRFEGQLCVFNLSNESACYQCLYSPDTQLNENCFEQGVLSPVVGTIGTLQATEALKILIGAGKVLDGQLLLYDALNADFRKLKVNKDPSCLVCAN